MHVRDRAVIRVQLCLIVCREGPVLALNELGRRCREIYLCHTSSAVHAKGLPLSSPCPYGTRAGYYAHGAKWRTNPQAKGRFAIICMAHSRMHVTVSCEGGFGRESSRVHTRTGRECGCGGWPLAVPNEDPASAHWCAPHRLHEPGPPLGPHMPSIPVSLLFAQGVCSALSQCASHPCVQSPEVCQTGPGVARPFWSCHGRMS